MGVSSHLPLGDRVFLFAAVYNRSAGQREPGDPLFSTSLLALGVSGLQTQASSLRLYVTFEDSNLAQQAF